MIELYYCVSVFKRSLNLSFVLALSFLNIFLISDVVVVVVAAQVSGGAA